MGRAEELFQHIRTGGTAEIQRMITEAVTEELFLDYKQAATTSFSKLDPSDRKNLAKAISGFGNSDGGIIVWGVDCPQAGVPRSAPVGDPVAFKSLIEDAVGGVTLPAHGGVENEALQLPHGTGYVVTHIPAGLNVPYRTLVKGEKEEYYIRAGSSFMPTPHAVLAGLFGRAPHSILEIEIVYEGFNNPGGVNPRLQLRFPVALRNNGRGLARGVFVCIDTEAPTGCSFSHPIDRDKWQCWISKTDRGYRFSAVATETFPAIPPGSKGDVLSLVLEIPKEVLGDAIINITCGTETGPGSAYAVTLNKDALNQALENLTHSYNNAPEREAAEKVARSLIEACLHARA
jgi:hypothetical protein